MQLRPRLLTTLTVAGTLVAAVALHAQADRARALQEQIDRIFKAREYDPPRFGPARWLPDGTAYAIVERTAGGAEGPRSSATTPRPAREPCSSASSRASCPPARKAPLDIDDYAWSRTAGAC